MVFFLAVVLLFSPLPPHFRLARERRNWNQTESHSSARTFLAIRGHRKSAERCIEQVPPLAVLLLLSLLSAEVLPEPSLLIDGRRDGGSGTNQ